MSYKKAAQAIIAVMSGLDASKIPVHYGYTENMPEKFPAAVVQLAGSPSERRVDGRSTEVTAKFEVSLLFPAVNSADNFIAWCDALDELLGALRSNRNRTLDGTAVEVTVDGVTQQGVGNSVAIVSSVSVRMLESTI